MTGIRQSMVYARESSFSEGKAGGYVWVQPPPNSYFQSTPSQSVSRMQSMGTKFADGFIYGAFSGSWEWSFMLDYDYMEPLTLIFESYTHNSISGRTGEYEHVFEKNSALRVPSFTVRQKVMNQMAGGPVNSDVIRELQGCVCTDFSMARSASSSQYQVTMSGFYADETMVKGTLLATDYKEYTPNLVEYSCLSIGASESADISACEYIANTMSVSIGIKNNAEAIYALCTSKPVAYSEGLSDFTFATTCYSNDPSHYQQRMYSGGYDNTALTPATKGRKPIAKIHLTSFCNERGTDTIASAYDNSDYAMDIDLTGVPIRSIPWVKGDGSKLQDSISGSECKRLKLTIHSRESSFDTTRYTATSAHAVASSDMASSYPLAKFYNDAPNPAVLLTTIVGPYFTVPACTATRAGYTCTSWCEGPSSAASRLVRIVGESCQVSSDTSYYTKWDVVTYPITFVIDEGTSWYEGYTPPSSYNVTSDTITLPTSDNISRTVGEVSYTFGGWYLVPQPAAGSEVQTQIANGSTGDKIYYPKWIAPATNDSSGDE